MTYTYNKERKLTKTEDSDGRTATYEYDKIGNLILEKTNQTTTIATGENNSL